MSRYIRKKPLLGAYTGVLADPLELRCTPGVPSILPVLKRLFGISDEQAQQFFLRAYQADLDDWFGRVNALSEHFEIDKSKEAWPKDLLDALKQRHSPETTYGELFLEIGIKSDKPGADFAAALNLAHRFVPGFQPPATNDPGGPFTTTEVIRLLVALSKISNAITATGKVASDHAVAAVMLDGPKRRSALGPGLADTMGRFISEHGNAKRGTPSDISERTLRAYMRQIREAPKAFRETKATPFQMQLVLHDLPTLAALQKTSK
jgi:hypothetical protein